MSTTPTATETPTLHVRWVGHADYQEIWNAMREFTDARGERTPDEIWVVEHPPVYTMGMRGRDGDVRDIGGIPLVYTDRGGDITYHGPGQLVLYVLLDLRRLGIGIKTLVNTLEQAIIDYTAHHGIPADRRSGAPGVYVNNKKIAALGLRVRNSCSYHGLSLNVNMDLAPFSRINPCGYEGLEVTQLADLGASAALSDVATALLQRLARRLGYNSPINPADL